MFFQVSVHAVLEPAPQPVVRTLVLPGVITLDELRRVLDVCFGWPDGQSEFTTDALPQVRYTRHDAVSGGKRNKANLSKRKQERPMEGVPLFALLNSPDLCCYYHEAYRIGRVALYPGDEEDFILMRRPELRLKDWEGQAPLAKPLDTERLEALFSELKPAIAAEHEARDRLADQLFEELHPNWQDEDDDWDDDEWDDAARYGDMDIAPSLEDLIDMVPEAEREQVRHFFSMLGTDGKENATFSLRQCLEWCRKDDLCQIARRNQFTGFSKLRRAELIDFLEARLSAPQTLRELLSVLAIRDLELLDILTEENLPVLTYEDAYQSNQLIASGLCYLTKEQPILVLPREIAAEVRKFLEDPEFMAQAKIFDLYYQYSFSAVYLYGVWPLDQLERQLRAVLPNVPNRETLWRILRFISERRQEMYVFGDLLLSPLLLDQPELTDLLLKQQREQGVFVPSSEQIGELAYEKFFRIDELDNLFAFLDQFYPDEPDVEEFVRLLDRQIRMGMEFDTVRDWALGVLALPDANAEKQFVPVLQNFWDNTPMWRNGGYSPNQLRKLQQKKDSGKKRGAQSKIVSLQERRQKKK